MSTKPHTDWLVRFAHKWRRRATRLLVRVTHGLDWFVAYCIGTAIFAVIVFVLEIVLT